MSSHNFSLNADCLVGHNKPITTESRKSRADGAFVTKLPDFLFLNVFRRKKDNRKKSITAQKRWYFKNLVIFEWAPHIMVFFTCIMVLIWCLPQGIGIVPNSEPFPDINWTKKNIIKYPVFNCVLIALPFWRCKSFQPIENTLSAIVLVISVIQLEIIFSREQCLVTYLLFMVIYRVVRNRTIFDNFAICVAYTSEVAAMSNSASQWFYSSNVFVWSFFLVVVVLAHMLKRLTTRVWEHVRVLIILREKTKLEKLLGNFIISAHMSEDVQGHLYPHSLTTEDSAVPPMEQVKAWAAKHPPPSVFDGSGAAVQLTGKVYLKPPKISAARVARQQQTSSAPIILSSAPRPASVNRFNSSISGNGGSSKGVLSPASAKGGTIAGLSRSGKSSRESPGTNSLASSSVHGSSTPIILPEGSKSAPSHYGMTRNNKRIDDDVLRSASQAGIIAPYSDARLTVAQLEGIGGMDKRNTVLVAIKPDCETKRECILNGLKEHDFMELVDHLAEAHRITRVRVFGNTWIGCLGVFQTWDATDPRKADAANVYHGVIFACEVAVAARRYFGRVSYAVDFGSVVGGFLSNSLNFDLFGQEVRWLLMMVELREFGVIALGDNARHQLHAYRKQLSDHNKEHNLHPNHEGYKDLNAFRQVELDQRAVSQPWKGTDAKVTVNYIVNADKMVEEEELETRVGAFYTSEGPSMSSKSTHSDVSSSSSSEKSLYALLSLAQDGGTGKLGPRPTVDWFTFHRLVDDEFSTERASGGGTSSTTGGGDLKSNNNSNFGGNSRHGSSSKNKHKKGAKSSSGKHERSTAKTAATPTPFSAGTHSLASMNIPVPGEYRGIEARLVRNNRLGDPHSRFLNLLSNSLHKPIDPNVELGLEFQTSVYERYGIRLDDPVLDRFTVEDLEQAHAEVEAEVYRVVARDCFPTLFGLLFMSSAYQDIGGANEYPSVMRGGKGGSFPMTGGLPQSCSASTTSYGSGGSSSGSGSGSSGTVQLETDDYYVRPGESIFFTNWLQYRFYTFPMRRRHGYSPPPSPPEGERERADGLEGEPLPEAPEAWWRGLVGWLLPSMRSRRRRPGHNRVRSRDDCEEKEDDDDDDNEECGDGGGDDDVHEFQQGGDFPQSSASDDRELDNSSSSSFAGFTRKPVPRSDNSFPAVQRVSSLLRSFIPSNSGSGDSPNLKQKHTLMKYQRGSNSRIVPEESVPLSSSSSSSGGGGGGVQVEMRQFPAQSVNLSPTGSRDSPLPQLRRKPPVLDARLPTRTAPGFADWARQVLAMAREEVIYHFVQPMRSLMWGGTGASSVPKDPSRSLDGASNAREFKRSWVKYSSDSRLLSHNTYVNLLLDVLLIAVTWYALRPAYQSPTAPRYFSLLIDFGFLHLFVPAVVERRYDTQVFFFLTAVRVCFFCFLPSSVLCANPTISGEGGYNLFGDLGGDSTVLLVTAFRIPSQVRQVFWFSIVDSFVIRVLVIRFWGSSTCAITATARTMSFLFNLNLALIYHVVSHRAFVSYIIEHKLLPFACDSYCRQKKNTRDILRIFAPSVPSHPTGHNSDMYVHKSYRNCAIAALHIKAPDILSGFIEARDLAQVMRQINAAVDSCIAECGMLKVTEFSGLCLAVACKDSSWDSIEGLRVPESYTVRAIVLMRRIQRQMEQLSRDYNFNLSLGVAINHGSASVGFLGNRRHCYDISGSARDMACAMACYNGDGIFASSVFDADIRKTSAVSEDATQRQMQVAIPSATSGGGTVSASHGIANSPRGAGPSSVVSGAAAVKPTGHYWLRIDGNLSGMQLEDFEYIGMLGRGGYGSVHLVQEKHTTVQYAIKTVVLKSGSLMSKMITRECIILQMMAHPNVVNLKYAFTNRNRMYLVMTYIRGGNLKQVLERDQLDLKHITLWFAEIVLALEYIHDMGIIHRDVKPANCMIGTDGHLRLADFGLSKIVSGPVSHNLLVHSPSVGNLLGSGGGGGDSGSVSSSAVHRSGSRSVDESEGDLHTASTLGLSREAYLRVQKFLPLKLNIANAKVQSKQRVFKIVSVRPGIKINSALKFSSVTIEMIIARNEEEALRLIRTSHIDAIFIDVDPKRGVDTPETWRPEQDGIELLRKFCTDSFNSIPVCITSTTLDLARMRPWFIEAGAREVFNKPLAHSEERLFKKLFAVTEAASGGGNSASGGNSGGHLSSAVTSTAPGTSHSGSQSGIVSGSITRVGGHSRHSVNLSSTKQAKSIQHSAVGTLHFIAPEVMFMCAYGKPVDWWALGISIYECVVGEHLFKGEDKAEVSNAIMTGPIDLKKLKPFGEPICSLVGGLLTRDVRKRLGSTGADRIKSHEFFGHIRDWSEVSECDPDYKPALFVNKKFDVADQVLFTGEPDQSDGKIYVGGETGKDSREHSRYSSSRRSHTHNHSRSKSLRKTGSRGAHLIVTAANPQKVRRDPLAAEQNRRKFVSDAHAATYDGGGVRSKRGLQNSGGLSGSMNLSTDVLHEVEDEDAADEDSGRQGMPGGPIIRTITEEDMRLVSTSHSHSYGQHSSKKRDIVGAAGAGGSESSSKTKSTVTQEETGNG